MPNSHRSLHLLLVGLVWLVSPVVLRADVLPDLPALPGWLHLEDDAEWDDPGVRETLRHKIPVLFAHGHNVALRGVGTEDPSYASNWKEKGADGLPSFHDALKANPHLGIEPYYLDFDEEFEIPFVGTRYRDPGDSISADADKIGQAVDMILRRHGDPDAEQVKVVIIAYSKGAISSRLYLKRHADQKKVSELIAIAPPNHGLSWPESTLPVMQLTNGYTPFGCCTYGTPMEQCVSNRRSCTPDGYGGCDFDSSTGCPSDFQGCDFNHPGGLHFIECLNGHSLCDTKGSAHIPQDEKFSSEAPGSRRAEEPVGKGVLYVVLGAVSNGDEFAGGEAPSNDCLGRKLAKNLAPDAVNRWVDVSRNGDVHENTPHTPRIICLALYTAAHHRAPLQDFGCEGEEETGDMVPKVPAPAAANAVLALDLSGSMSLSPCPDCGPKVGYLRDAAELFIKLWGIVARPQDRIGAVYFRSAASEFSVGSESMGPVGTHGDAIIADVALQQPSGSTAMGGALHSAISTLRGLPPEEGDARHVILFTDGMQNRNPMVTETDGGGLVIADDPAREPLPAGLAPIDLDELGGIKVNTVGVGTGDPQDDLLMKIAKRTGGHFRSTLDFEDLRQFFIENVVNVMRGFSPQLVDYRRSSTGEDRQAIESFEIDGGARRVVFVVSTGRGGEFHLVAGKDGHDLTGHGQLVRGSFYRILAFDLPIEIDGTTIEAGGVWHLEIRNTGGGEDLAYEVGAIVDGSQLHHEASLDGTTAGKPLKMTVRLTDGDVPVTGAEVSARIFNFGTSLGTVLATSPMPSDNLPTFETAATGGQRKLQALVTRTDIWYRLQPLEPLGVLVELTDRGDGTYRGTYDRTSIPGTYKATFDIRGTDSFGREYHRTETLFAELGLEILLPEHTFPEWRLLDRTEDVTRLELTLRPRDQLGNYLGPDYGHRIRVELDSGSVGEVVDRLDGSYEVTLTVPTDSDPSLELTVLGRSLYQGRLTAFPGYPGNGRWTVGGHLGLTVPVGAFDRLYDPGPLVELGLEYAVSPRFALHGVIGRYRFDPGFDVDGATLYLRYYRPWRSGGTRLFAEIGPGVYDPDGLGSAAGLSAGVGVVRPFRRHLESELGASYFHLFNSGDDIRFVSLKAGLRYSF